MIQYILTLFLIFFLLMSDMDRKIYLYTLYNFDYFVWLNNRSFSTTTTYSIKMTIMAILFPFLFPFVSVLIPTWDRLLGFEGEFYVVPISLHNDTKHTICKSVQSKLYWYNFFVDNKIKTPQVFYYFENGKIKVIKEMPEEIKNSYFIMKPEYGTQGSNVSKVTLQEFEKYIKTHEENMILQEYVKDCTSEKARHFRINTTSHNVVFSIIEKKQTSTHKIASNHANGGENTVCENLICDFLSKPEMQQIKEISKILSNVHSSKLHIIPIIGWDVCLTCNGPYLFEGNMGSDMSDDGPLLYKKYMEIMKEFYS